MILSLEEQEAKAARFRERQKEIDSRKAQRKLTNRIKKAETLAQRRKNQAALVALEHAQGQSVAEIAKKFRVSTQIVKERLRHADRYQLLERYTSATINELVPQALAVYQLTMSDLYHEVNKQVIDVATKVLEGTGVMGRERAATLVQEHPPGQGEISTIEEYRAMRITRIAQGQVQQAEPEGEIDENGRFREPGRGPVLDAHQTDPGGHIYSVESQLPGDPDRGGQDPAGGALEDQGCGG